MEKLTKVERIKRALDGGVVDKIPYSLWPHYPVIDLIPEILARTQVEEANKYGYDFIKTANPGLFSVIDYGTVYKKLSNGDPDVDIYGTLQVESYGVKSIDDWANLEVLDPTLGFMGRQLEVIKYMNKFLAESGAEKTPIIQTIFSPITTAYKLAGNNLLIHLREDEKKVKDALGVISETTVKFIEECLKLGVDGFFFASQLGDYNLLEEDEYRKFGFDFDMRVLASYVYKTFLNIIHIHGDRPMFKLMSEYPVNCLNWHDRWAGPSLVEARKLTNKCILGGIDESHALGVLSDDELDLHVKEALKMGGNKKFILGPGCTVYPNTPKSHFEIIQNNVSNSV